MTTIRNCFIILAAFTILIYVLQEKVTFFPIKSKGDFALPTIPGFTLKRVSFQAADGVKLGGLLVQHEVGSSSASLTGASGTVRPVVLYSHGNGGNLYYRLDHVVSLLKFPMDYFLYDYRGFGESEGTPTVAGAVLDAEAALNYVEQELKTPPEKILLFGVSLGTGITGKILEKMKNKCAGVILEAAFRSYVAMAGRRFPIIGPLVAKQNLPTDEILKTYEGPLLIIHSKGDEMIPFSDGEFLFQVSPSKKKFLYAIEKAGHNDGIWNDPAYVMQWEKFLELVFPK